ncbi:MAG TPA: MOSC N-terminal beta barrel domain-containing protein [Candidatus Paceibacterota bacterium]
MYVEQLFEYPIKSCKGIEVAELDLTLTGPKYDRTLMIVDEGGNFLSQRTHPHLCLIETDIGDDPGTNRGTAVWVEAPGMKRHVIPLSHAMCKNYPGTEEVEVVIHGKQCMGIDLGNIHANWFSAFLGEPVRLIQQVDRLPRIRHSDALDRNIMVSFADGYPLLITATESLDDLNKRIQVAGGQSVPMDRFRPNIVLSGGETYAEDTMNIIAIGNATLAGANKCVRCAITTTDQTSGKRDKEPLATLATYRKSGKGVEFGRNFVVTGPGKVRRGDKVRFA